MDRQPGIHFIFNDNTPEETFKHLSSALSPKALEKTQKLITDAIKDDELLPFVADMETFRGMIVDIFDWESRHALHKEWYSEKQVEEVRLQQVNPAFNEWFDKYFRKDSCTNQFKMYFYRHFRQEFMDNLAISLRSFLLRYPRTLHQEISSYVWKKYKELYQTVLTDTATQLELQYNGPRSLAQTALENDEDDQNQSSTIHISLN